MMLSSNLVHGVGITDIKTTGDNAQAYKSWKGMLSRCFSDKVHAVRPNYIGCTISQEWAYFSKFKEWFDDNYRKGYHLDKDIIAKGNKIYCAQYCRFVPAHINSLMSQKKNPSTGLPGVHLSSPSKGINSHFRAVILIDGKQITLGHFEDKLDAFDAYKLEKESVIKQQAIESYRKNEICKDILTAMLEYKVER